RADVAARTGLTRATVSALVDRLIAAGMLAQLPPAISRRAGRPAVPLVAAGGTFAAIGLEINVSYLGGRAVDLSGQTLTEHLEVHDFHQSSPSKALDLLASMARDMLESVTASGVCVIGAGIALPGIVDHESGTLRLAPNLGWRDVELADVLTRSPFASLNVVELANEANLAAWTEARAHPEPRPSFLYVSGEVGIGGGLVYEGQVFQGQRGWSGELGHTTVKPDGPACPCGSRGCLERYAGRDAVMTAAGLDPLTPVEGLLARLEDGSVRARRAVDRAGWALGVALANALNLVDIDEVVLGGFYAPLTERLTPAVAEQLQMRVLSAAWSRPQVRPVASGQQAAMTGAALSVLRMLVDDPTAWGAGAEAPTATVGTAAQ
ncbi:MAG TPA: ROK family transcriptional regulator, partial [Nocardioidaceae bacterium]|nr:ROK family transcriptional regulator [Nocardioidaceae bacterium]